MIRQSIANILIFSALFLTPYNNAAEHNDPLDTLLKEQFSYPKREETPLQKSWRLTKEYGPFATSVALGSYLTYTSMQQQTHRIIPELAITGINAYALYKSHTLTKAWLKQLPTERTYPFQLSLLCVTGFATCFCSEYFFEPSYIAVLSSLILLTTSTFNFIDTHGTQHRQDKDLIHNTTNNITRIMLYDELYDSFIKNASVTKKFKIGSEKYYETLRSYQKDQKKIAYELKKNTVEIMQLPWGPQFFAGLSKNTRHAIFKSVAWQIEYPNKHELNMGASGYPEALVVLKCPDDIYAIKKS